MKLAFLTNIPSPYRTAFYNRLDEHCKARGLDLEVWYCALTEPDRHWKFVPAENRYEFRVVKGWHLVIHGFPFHLNPSVFTIVRQTKPQILIAGGSWNMPSNWLALVAMMGLKISRGFWSEGHAAAARFRRGPVAWIRRAFLKQYDFFVVPNGTSESWIREDLGVRSPCVFLANTVDETVFDGDWSEQAAQYKRRLGFDAEETVLLQVSQLEPRKGVVELVNAYRALPSVLRERTVLVFLGTGSLEVGLSRSLQDWRGPGRVVFVGQVAPEDVAIWLRAADWFILNTFRDPNPLSVIEAAFTGLPLVVSSYAGNIRELVRDGESGFVIQDPRQPIDVLKHVLNIDAKDRLALGRKAQALARKHFTRDVVIERFLDDLTGIRMQSVDDARALD